MEREIKIIYQAKTMLVLNIEGKEYTISLSDHFEDIGVTISGDGHLSVFPVLPNRIRFK